jgi:hypothetical protein
MSKSEPGNSEKFIDGIIPEKSKMLEDRKAYLEKQLRKPFAVIKESY